MPNSKKSKIIYSSLSVDGGTGEVLNETTVKRYPAEPPFVKLYLDTPPSNISPKWAVLVGLLSVMSYSDAELGNYVQLSKKGYEQIAESANLSASRVRHIVADFAKSGIIRRDGDTQELYQVNPYLFGKGEWLGVAQLRDSWPLK